MLVRASTTLHYKGDSLRPMNILCCSNVEDLIPEVLLDVQQARGAV
jgi:hypothetical protein